MPGFAQDIRPLFRDRDRQAMLFAFDLGEYDEVRANAAAIHEQVASGDMPCDVPWSPEQVDLFQQWMDGGFQP
jgi:hypothetical protein